MDKTPGIPGAGVFHASGHENRLLFQFQWAAAVSHGLDCLTECRAEVDLQGVGDTQQGVDRRKAFALFDAHDHCVAQAGTRGDFVEGQLLPETFCVDRFNQAGDDRFALVGFRHSCFLRHELLDSGYDHRHNRASRTAAT